VIPSLRKLGGRPLLWAGAVTVPALWFWLSWDECRYGQGFGLSLIASALLAGGATAASTSANRTAVVRIITAAFVGATYLGVLYLVGLVHWIDRCGD
jgi:hypothetical protein